MLQAGYDFMKYSSHEKTIEDNKSDYYIHLMRGQKNIIDNKFPVEWFEFFLTCLSKQTELLKDKIKFTQDKFTKVQKSILEFLRKQDKATNGDICGLYGFNPNTVKKAFKELSEQNKIVAFGDRKNRYYMLNTSIN